MGITRLCSFLEALGENVFLLFAASRGCLHSLGLWPLPLSSFKAVNIGLSSGHAAISLVLSSIVLSPSEHSQEKFYTFKSSLDYTGQNGHYQKIQKQ